MIINQGLLHNFYFWGLRMHKFVLPFCFVLNILFFLFILSRFAVLWYKSPSLFHPPFNSKHKNAFHWKPWHFFPMYYFIKVSHMAKTQILSSMTPTLFARILRDICSLFPKRRAKRVRVIKKIKCEFWKYSRLCFYETYRQKTSAFPVRKNFQSPLSSHLFS